LYITPEFIDLASTIVIALLKYGYTAVSPRAASFNPDGKNAGSAGVKTVQFRKDHLGWWYDWTPQPTSVPGVVSISMLWGNG
jgi:hypothetical protein